MGNKCIEEIPKIDGWSRPWIFSNCFPYYLLWIEVMGYYDWENQSLGDAGNLKK
jgi:hypothetical protein